MFCCNFSNNTLNKKSRMRKNNEEDVTLDRYIFFLKI